MCALRKLQNCQPLTLRRAAIFAIAVLLLLRGAVVADDRFALVIGNSAYANQPLKNPGNDADSVAGCLKTLGFTVFRHTDLDRRGMGNALAEFRRKLTPQSVAFFYFAGHGIQVAGENFLVPIGADPKEEYEVRYSCLPLGQVLDALDESASNLKMIVLDCCRDNPFARSWTRSRSTRGLAAIAEAPRGTLIAFATSPGHVSADGIGDNSPYTLQLCRSLRSRPSAGLEVVEMFRQAHVCVAEDGKQVPWMTMSALPKYFLWQAMDLEPVITNSIGMKMVLIPAGTFMMGSASDEVDRNSNESPRHRVRITNPFYLGECEVTQGQYETVMKEKPWLGMEDAQDRVDNAASYVNWNAAVAFCQRLSELEKRMYRLPTEAQWEYACRAGTSTAFCCGNDPAELVNYAWFSRNAHTVGNDFAHPVRQKRANLFGLYDMHGNVFEWCADWYGVDYYAASPADDPTGPPFGTQRVLRGGCWGGNSGRCRSANRGRSESDSRVGSILGFRVVLDPLLRAGRR